MDDIIKFVLKNQPTDFRTISWTALDGFQARDTNEKANKPPFPIVLVLLLLNISLTTSVALAQAGDARKHGVLIFSGQYTTADMKNTANIFSFDYESNYLFAVAYSQDMIDFGYGLHIGPEVGVACRFGNSRSGEIWGGVALRHQGVTVGGHLRIAPALIFGLSAVDKAIGTERTRQGTQEGNAGLLFYLSPELSFSLVSSPQWEIVYRLHHRSGGYRTLGNLKGGHNANTIGVRYRF